jgi:hypothetical protein
MDAATLSLQLGDVEGYRRHARGMLDAFGSTDDPMAAERTAKIGLLMAPSPEEAARLTALAELAVTKGADSPVLPWFQLARGMAAYRDGQLAAAADRLQKVRSSTGASVQCETAALLFVAMSHSRLGRLPDARAALETARRSLQVSPRPADEGGEHWHDWLISQIALREAEAVIGPAAPAAARLPARDQ